MGWAARCGVTWSCRVGGWWCRRCVVVALWAAGFWRLLEGAAGGGEGRRRGPKKRCGVKAAVGPVGSSVTRSSPSRNEAQRERRAAQVREMRRTCVGTGVVWWSVVDVDRSID